MSDEELVRRARTMSGMLIMGEPVSFGSDAGIIDALADAIERLTRERDVTHLIAVRAERKVERLREALRPFVDAYNNTIAGEEDKWRDTDSLWESAAAMALEASDLRRARAALAETENSDEAI